MKHLRQSLKIRMTLLIETHSVAELLSKRNETKETPPNYHMLLEAGWLT
jgi:hypothetical protein